MRDAQAKRWHRMIILKVIRLRAIAKKLIPYALPWNDREGMEMGSEFVWFYADQCLLYAGWEDRVLHRYSRYFEIDG